MKYKHNKFSYNGEFVKGDIVIDPIDPDYIMWSCVDTLIQQTVRWNKCGTSFHMKIYLQ